MICLHYQSLEQLVSILISISIPYQKKTREIKCEKNKTMQKILGTLKFVIFTYIT